MSNVTPWSWASYQRPTMNQAPGQTGTQGFFTPSDSKLMTPDQLASYLNPGTVAGQTNRTVKYDGGLTREMLGNSTDFLNGQLGTGFKGINDTLNSFGGLGGLGGMSGGSPVYRPGGAPVGQGPTNGQPLPWGVSNPFNQTF